MKKKKTWRDTVKMRSKRLAAAFAAFGKTRLKEASDEEFEVILKWLAGEHERTVKLLKSRRNGAEVEEATDLQL